MVMYTFEELKSSFTPTIFSRDFFSDFGKIEQNTFNIKVQLNILNSLLGEKDIDSKFITLITKYPDIREVLPILLAVRGGFNLVLDSRTKEIVDTSNLFDKNYILDKEGEKNMLHFLNESGLKGLFSNKKISNLNDYVFGVETGLDSNARKNRSGTAMENLVEDFIKEFCITNCFTYKTQATTKRVYDNRGFTIKSDKLSRRFDFAINTGKKVYLFETNFYGGGGSKLKAVAGEFSGLYNFLKQQGIELIRVTDGLGWQSTLHPLEDAYKATDGHIYNISMLKNNILQSIIT